MQLANAFVYVVNRFSRWFNVYMNIHWVYVQQTARKYAYINYERIQINAKSFEINFGLHFDR